MSSIKNNGRQCQLPEFAINRVGNCGKSYSRVLMGQSLISSDTQFGPNRYPLSGVLAKFSSDYV